MSDKKHRVSEIFRSIQGEGHYTGVPTAWVRFFGCNLNCKGFGQKDPTDPSTYILPYEEFDPSTINSVEELPVWEYGCDSSYSWAKKFNHLQMRLTAEEIVDKVEEVMRSPFNPDGRFHHPTSNQRAHLCFTGGEPLLKGTQGAIREILEILDQRHNTPDSITFETNGTKPLTEDLLKFFLSDEYYPYKEVFFSVSPKLFTVSGERNVDAIKPDVVADLSAWFGGQLKFVMGAEERQWDELDRVVKLFKEEGVWWPVWIMPVGATEAGQHGDYGGHASAGEVANMAIERGYNVSPRVHVYLWGNIIGV